MGRQRQEHFEDPDFAASDASIYSNGHIFTDGRKVAVVSWKRLSQLSGNQLNKLWPVDSHGLPQPLDIVQGALEDKWLMEALCGK